MALVVGLFVAEYSQPVEVAIVCLIIGNRYNLPRQEQEKSTVKSNKISWDSLLPTFNFDSTVNLSGRCHFHIDASFP